MIEHPRRVARRLVAVTRGGDLDPRGVPDPNELTAGPGLRAVLHELVQATASMMLTRADGPAPDRAFVLDLRDDAGETVEVDDLDPPVRALVRALLAELNGMPEDTELQLDLALREDPRFDPMDILVLALLWTVGSMEWCEQHDVPKPGWLG